MSGLEAPQWQRPQYGSSEILNLGIVSVVVQQPIGTQGKPPPPFYITIGHHKLKREFEDREEAKIYGLRTARAWLERAVTRAAMVDPTPTNPNSRSG